jgi:hypothetical protein
MQHLFETHSHETDTETDGEDRRHRNDRRGQSDRRKRDRRGSANFSQQPLLSEAEIAALLNGAR